jgi:hypothetical protein
MIRKSPRATTRWVGTGFPKKIMLKSGMTIRRKVIPLWAATNA